MQDILFSLNIVLPIILIICLGYLVKRLNIISNEVFNGINKVCFRIFLPVSLFKSVYSASNIKDVKISFVLFIIITLILMFLIFLIAIKLTVKDDLQKGVILQGLIRSNYAIIGVPLAGSIAGSSGEALASIIAIVTIPIFNILATIALIIFVDNNNTEKKEKNIKNIRNIFKNLITNPLLQAIFLGIVCLIVRMIFEKNNISFRLSNITFFYETISKIAGVSIPLSLFALGGLFEFSYVKKLKKQIIPTVLLRLVINPIIIFTISLILFNFSSSEYAVLIAIFAAPIAVSSAVMAKEMNNDGDLANQLVVWSTIFSGITIFLIIYIFRLMKIF